MIFCRHQAKACGNTVLHRIYVIASLSKLEYLMCVEDPVLQIKSAMYNLSRLCMHAYLSIVGYVYLSYIHI